MPTQAIDPITHISSTDDFGRVGATIRSHQGYRAPQAFALGVSLETNGGEKSRVLSVMFPHVNILNDKNRNSAAIFQHIAGVADQDPKDRTNSVMRHLDARMMERLFRAYKPYIDEGGGYHPNILALRAIGGMDKQECLGGKKKAVVVFIYDLEAGPINTYDMYLRMHLISAGKPAGTPISDVGGSEFLTDCIWTKEEGPIEACDFEQLHLKYMADHSERLTVISIDRYPPLTNFVVPTQVRMVDPNVFQLGHPYPAGTYYQPAQHTLSRRDYLVHQQQG